LGQQGVGRLALSALVRNLALAEERAAGVGDRPDQEDPPRFGAGAGQGLAVESRGGQQPGRRRVFHGPLGGAALFALDGPWGAWDLGRRCGSGFIAVPDGTPLWFSRATPGRTLTSPQPARTASSKHA
jgi:hypothetical protein